ncbi:DUF1799 domain-containing protein [Acidimangrovimonas sediminis]|uniref:DUF1799 domain-containing protein n=1 Tax=Acidimangrovimonas sediminis TaxID=2056283 RepID=UPI0022B91D9B|nr:DUF1799 domain-containing protein [Acidimangrovimonas sediminis]
MDEDALWPEHLDALHAFLAIASQWRFAAAGMGSVMAIGLDYQGAQAGLALAGIEVAPETWAQVQVIEGGAREAMNKRRQR